MNELIGTLIWIWDSIVSGAIGFWADVLVPLGRSVTAWAEDYMAWLTDGIRKLYGFTYNFFIMRFHLRITSFTFLVIIGLIVATCSAVANLFRKRYRRRRK